MTAKERQLEQQGVIEALVAAGVDGHNAAFLAKNYSAVLIEKQIAGMAQREHIQNRVSYLIAAIKNDYAAPEGRPPPGGAPVPQEKFYAGRYALCPQCQQRPCAPLCPTLVAPEEVAKARAILAQLAALGCTAQREGEEMLYLQRPERPVPADLQAQAIDYAAEIWELVGDGS